VPLGTDNIKTYGESLAQILWFIGVRPWPIPSAGSNNWSCSRLRSFGRPRIDVVVNCSVLFRESVHQPMG